MMLKSWNHVTKSLLAGFILTAGLGTTLQAKDLGLGVIIGEPTGITAKKWLDNGNAVDFAAAWSTSGNDSLQVHADYLFHQGQVPVNADTHGQLPWYWGVGIRVKLKEDDNNNSRNNNDNLIGIRIPVGLAWYPENTDIEVFGELSPTLDFAPNSDFDLGVGLGARYYF